MRTVAFSIVLLALPSPAFALEVVATLPDLAAIASAVGGDAAEVTALASATEDPHYVDPRPSLMLPLNRADLLILNGLSLEVSWLPPLIQGARNAQIIPGAEGYFDASTAVKRLGVPTGKIDRAMGDVHPGGNPHYTHDPRRAIEVVRALAEKMAALEPSAADTFRKNARRLVEQLERVAAEERRRFAELPAVRRRVVVYHASFPYLNDWLQLEQVITVEPKPGIPPAPGRVATVLERMRANEVRAIIQEAHYPKNVSNTLAKLAEGKVAVVPTATRFEAGESYLERIRRTAREVYGAL